jgi:hypothetical protein
MREPYEYDKSLPGVTLSVMKKERKSRQDFRRCLEKNNVCYCLSMILHSNPARPYLTRTSNCHTNTETRYGTWWMISFSSIRISMNITVNLVTIFSVKVNVWSPSVGVAVKYWTPACLKMSSLIHSTSVLGWIQVISLQFYFQLLHKV